jgi:hypothetical protein
VALTSWEVLHGPQYYVVGINGPGPDDRIILCEARDLEQAENLRRLLRNGGIEYDEIRIEKVGQR